MSTRGSCNNRTVAVNNSVLLKLAFVFVAIYSQVAECLPIQSHDQAMIYLSQFGYLNPAVRNPSSGSIISQDTWKKAVTEFQSFAGLNITGELDEETRTLMSLPRCGVKDKVGFGTDSRSKRYALQGSRWKVKDLTYKISKYPRKLVKSAVDAEISRAFNVWSKYTDLTFTQKNEGSVHIEIRFERGEHGDGDPFDGPGGTLAHAYFPVYGGDAHFDDSEAWSIDTYRGTNLFQVAAHEFGHSLGLSHSDTKSALMAPFYRGYEPVFNLDSDDISGIQALYGQKTRKTKPNGGGGGFDYDGSDTKGSRKTTPAPPKPGSDDSILCRDSRIDTLFNSAEGVTYAFKGDYYWRLADEGIANGGYPKRIRDGWPGLPGNIDAAFTYKNGKTYFFKGTQYWRYTGRKVDGAYPKDISEGFTGIPDNIDAALVWSGNGKIYFYKGSKFWRFDPSQRPPVKSTYPKPISNWEGVPDNLDAALHYTNGYTYFFKGGQYYRFNDRSFSVDQADPGFPRSTGYWWFGCKSGYRAGTSAELVSNQRDTGDVGDIIMDAADPSDENPAKDARRNSANNQLVTPFIALLSSFLLLRINSRLTFG